MRRSPCGVRARDCPSHGRLAIGPVHRLPNAGRNACHTGFTRPIERRQRTLRREGVRAVVARHLQPIDPAHVLAPPDDLPDDPPHPSILRLRWQNNLASSRMKQKTIARDVATAVGDSRKVAAAQGMSASEINRMATAFEHNDLRKLLIRYRRGQVFAVSWDQSSTERRDCQFTGQAPESRRHRTVKNAVGTARSTFVDADALGRESFEGETFHFAPCYRSSLSVPLGADYSNVIQARL